MPDTDLPDWATEAAPATAAPAAQDQDAALPDWVKDADTPANAPARPVHAHPAARAAPSPAPSTGPTVAPVTVTAPHKPSAPPANLSWGDAAKEAWNNLPSSALQTAAGIGHAITHPVATVQNLGQLGAGVLSQAEGALGVQQDPQQKAKTEALAKALEQHYAQSYGSVKGFKNAIASDPVSVAMDAATLLSGGAGAVGKAAGLAGKIDGLAGAANAVGKVADVAGKVGSAIDPVSNSLRLAKTVAKPAVALARGTSSAVTGVPSSLMKVAAEAGKTSDPALRGAFLKFYTGQGDPAEFLGKMQGALGGMRQDASDAYLAKKSSLANAAPSFAPIDQAIADARAKTMVGGIRGPQFGPANDALDQAQAIVDHWKSNASNAAFGNLFGFDNLKQSIWDLRDQVGNNAAQDALGGVYNGVKQSITDVDPEYAKLMEQWQTARNTINDTQRTLVGAGKNPSATTAMMKTLRALKTPTGKNVFAQVATQDPELPYMMAGYALHPWGAGGKAGLFEAMQGVPLAAVTTALTHNPVLGGAQLAGQAALQSPKIAGALNFGAGAAQRLGKPLGESGVYDASKGANDAAGEAPQSAAALPAPEAQTAALPGSDAAWSAMLQRESNGHQLKPDGTPVTSSKGALGLAQVMPGTGPEAAKMAGVPWDPQRLRTDPEYNAKIGHAYYLMLLDMFGDPLKAAAAYNGGPKVVVNAVMASHQMHDDWIHHLNPETHDYVQYVSSRMRSGRASGGKVDRLEQLVGRLMKLAKEAKKLENKRTEPLLRAPDEAIVRALDVAKRAI